MWKLLRLCKLRVSYYSVTHWITPSRAYNHIASIPLLQQLLHHILTMVSLSLSPLNSKSIPYAVSLIQGKSNQMFMELS